MDFSQQNYSSVMGYLAVLLEILLRLSTPAASKFTPFKGLAATFQSLHSRPESRSLLVYEAMLYLTVNETSR